MTHLKTRVKISSITALKLKSHQLHHYLQQHGLASLFLLTGDEPLQFMECADTVRQVAHERGFRERLVLTVDTGFDWSHFSQQANHLSLFALKRLLELRLGNRSPGEAGAKALIAYAEKPPADTVLLITADKLDANKQQTKWFNALDKHGVIISVWPLERAQLPAWIMQRLTKYGLQVPAEAITIIAERSEGHLLACAQEIEKLHLLYGRGQVTTDQVVDAVTDSARFEAFAWVDTVLSGDASRSIRQLRGLQAENCDPILIIWALNREIRQLCQMAYALKAGQALEQIWQTFHVWQSRKNVMAAALKRFASPRPWQQFLRHTVHIEGIIKGANSGNVWEELLLLSLRVTGTITHTQLHSSVLD